MKLACLTFVALGALGCAGARTSVRARTAEYPISMTHQMRAADGHLLTDRERATVGKFEMKSTVFGLLYEAIPLNPTTDISEEVNSQVKAANGEAITDLHVSAAACATDYFVVFHLIPFWPGCATIRVNGTIIKTAAAAP
jgi:hypothetical protein